MTITGNTIHDCTSYGIELYVFGPGPNVLSNQVYACGTGIDVGGNTLGSTLATVSGDTVFNNTTGITVSGNINVTQNVVYGQSGTGISTGSIDEVLANTVHDNAIGISSYASGGPIENNTVYHNSGDGIEAQQNTPVMGNTVYDNATGVALDYSSTGLVNNNLVYENKNAGHPGQQQRSPLDRQQHGLPVGGRYH